MKWNSVNDTLSMKSIEFEPCNIFTKRIILSRSMRLYDPLGLFTVILIKAKLLIQEVTVDKSYGWDTPLPPYYVDKWLEIQSDIERASKFIVPRIIFPNRAQFSLHVFSDSSIIAYGCVFYLSDGVETKFLTSKSRVSPISRELTICQLELMACFISTQFVNFILQNLSISEIHFWLDSQVALYWINDPENLKQFQRNRVKEILKHFDPNQFHYVPSEINPADAITHGMSFDELMSHDLFWSGPKFLIEGKENWPKWNVTSASQEKFEEISVGYVNVNTVNIDNHGIQSIITKEFSKLRKLLNVTSYVLRAVHVFRKDRIRFFGPLTARELISAKLIWIKACQAECYAKEISLLELEKKNRLIKQLDLFLDKEDGLIKSKGLSLIHI